MAECGSNTFRSVRHDTASLEREYPKRGGEDLESTLPFPIDTGCAAAIA